MSSCDNSNIKKNYIVTGTEQDILSACTAIYTNSIENCSGNTLDINSSILSTNDINATNITLSGVLSACTGIYTSNLYGCSPITIQDELILSAVTNNNTLEEILVIDSSGLIQYRDLSSLITGGTTFVSGTTFSSNQAVLTRNDGFDVLKLSGGSNVTLSNPSTNQIKIDVSIPPDTNTFVSGFTYDNVNTFTISRNDNVDLTSTISVLSGITYYGDGSNLSGVTSDNFYVSGGTYNDTTKNINFTGNSVETTFNVDLTSLYNSLSANTFVIGGTYVDSTDTLSLLRNDGNFVNITGITDTFTTGSTYDNSTATATFTRNDGNTYTLDLSTIDVNDTFSTGFTYDNVNTFTISRNDGVDLSTTITTLSGVTYYGNGIGLTNIPLSGVTNLQTELDSKLNINDFNTYSGNVQNELITKVSGATNLSSEGLFAQKNGLNLEFKGLTSTGGTVNITSDSNTVNFEVTFPIDQDKFVSGGTYNDTTKNINFTGNSVETTFNVDLTSLYNSLSGDTFVISGNADAATSQLTFTNNTGGTFTVTNSAALFSDNDINVTGGTYNPSTGCVTFTTNSGTTFDVCGFVTGITDTYTTGSTLVGETIQFNSNVLGPNYYNVSLSPVLSGKTDLSLFNTHTGDTNNPHQTSFGNLISTAHTHTLSEITDFNSYSGNVQTQLDSKVENGVNSGGASEVFSGKLGTDLYFRTISGGTNTTVTTIGDIIKIDSADDNFYVTGFTYNDANTLTISQNGGLGDLTSTINTMTGLTIYGDLYVTGDTTLGPLTATSVTSNSEINVFNGHVNLRDNSYFLQGRTGADVNVSLIGVDNQDRVFVGNAGYDTYIDSNTIVNGALTADTFFISNTPTLNSGGTDILIRNSSTGEIEYRPVSGITPDTNTFVTGGTYNESTDTITLTRNDAVTIDITGVTDTFTTGSTYDNGTATATFTRNNGTSYTLDLSTIDVNDTFSTGGTVTQSSSNNENNQTIQIVGNDGFTPFNITGVTDTFVTGGTYNNTTSLITFDRNDNTSFSVDLSTLDLNDTYVTGGTLTQPTDNTNSGLINLLYSQDVSPSTYSIPYTDTFITGFTYNNNNTFTIVENNGDTHNVTFNEVSGLTVNGILDVTGDLNVTGTTFYTNITGTSIGVDYIDFNNTGITPPPDIEGRIYWDEDNGTLSLGMHGGQVLQQIGLEQYYYVKNQSGATIDNGRVVRAAGTLGSSGRILGEYMIADGTIPAKFTLGIATENIVDGDDGYVTEFGLVRGIDASGSLYGESWSGGTILYVSPTIPGGLTSVEPTAPDLKIEMAIVIDASANGSIFVRPSRYPHIYDLQEVNYSAGTENNLDILQWNESNLTWDKTNTPSFSGITVYNNINHFGNYILDGDISQTGNYNVTGNTTQIGNINLTGDLGIIGDTNQTGNLTLTGNTTQIGDVDLTGNVLQNGDYDLIGNLDITGNTTQSGNNTLTGNLTVTGLTELNGLTTVYGNTPISAAIQPGVDNSYDLGAPSFKWREIWTTNIDVTNDATIEFLYVNNSSNFFNTSNFRSGGVNITGDTTQIGNFIITGNTIQNGDVDLTGNVTQLGDYSLVGNLNITGDTTQSGNTTTNGTVDIIGSGTGCTLSVTGKTCLEGDLEVTGDVFVVGNLDYDGNLIVTGATIISSGLTVFSGVSADFINITTTPNENNDLIQILGRNSSSGLVEYRDVKTIGNNITIVTGSTYSATTTDDVIGIDSSTNTVTLYLPDSVSSGRLRYDIKDIGVNSFVNPITVQAAGSDTIITTSVVSSFELSADGGAVILVNTGTGQWWQM